jgi:hypothetical protein
MIFLNMALFLFGYRNFDTLYQAKGLLAFFLLTISLSLECYIERKNKRVNFLKKQNLKKQIEI